MDVRALSLKLLPVMAHSPPWHTLPSDKTHLNIRAQPPARQTMAFRPTLYRLLYAVTGADAGLGLAMTTALVERGGTVMMGCQSLQRGQAISEKINQLTGYEM